MRKGGVVGLDTAGEGVVGGDLEGCLEYHLVRGGMPR